MIGVKLFVVIVMAGLFTLWITACQPVSTPELAPAAEGPEKTASATVPAETQPAEEAPAPVAVPAEPAETAPPTPPADTGDEEKAEPVAPEVKEDEDAAREASPAATTLEEPDLRDELQRSGEMTPSDKQGNFDDIGLGVGETAINFTLRDTGGQELTLSRLLAEKPVVMVFGAFT